MKGLAPDHNTIAYFRKDNPKAIRKIFQATFSLSKNFDLICAKLLAGDSTKLRAQNSKKHNFDPAKIERNLAYIDEKLADYNKMLAQQDKDADDGKKAEILEKIDRHTTHRPSWNVTMESSKRLGLLLYHHQKNHSMPVLMWD